MGKFTGKTGSHIILMLLLTVFPLSLTSCKNSENTLSTDNDKSRSTQSSISESVSESTNSDTQSKPEAQSEINEYGGTFNEEVFDKIVSNVVIGDKTFSFPCSLEDLGEGFSYQNETMIVDEESELRSCVLLYEGESLATVTLHCTADDDNYSDNEIICLRFSVYDFNQLEKISVLSVGGFTFKNNYMDIFQFLGEPSREFESDGGKASYFYELSSSSSIHFFFNNDGYITEIGIYNGGK